MISIAYVALGVYPGHLQYPSLILEDLGSSCSSRSPSGQLTLVQRTPFSKRSIFFFKFLPLYRPEGENVERQAFQSLHQRHHCIISIENGHPDRDPHVHRPVIVCSRIQAHASPSAADTLI